MVPYVESVVKALDDSSGYVQWQAERALVILGPRVGSNAVFVARRLHNENASKRCAAAQLLSHFGHSAMPFADMLLDMVECGDPNESLCAARTLDELGYVATIGS